MRLLQRRRLQQQRQQEPQRQPFWAVITWVPTDTNIQTRARTHTHTRKVGRDTGDSMNVIFFVHDYDTGVNKVKGDVRKTRFLPSVSPKFCTGHVHYVTATAQRRCLHSICTLHIHYMCSTMYTTLTPKYFSTSTLYGHYPHPSVILNLCNIWMCPQNNVPWPKGDACIVYLHHIEHNAKCPL